MRRFVRHNGGWAVAACVAATAFTFVATAAPVTLPKPLPAEVYVKSDTGPATPLRGGLVRYDDLGFTLHVGTDDKTLGWTDITPATAFALRQKTIDRTKPDQLLALGRFGWSILAKDQARQTLAAAVRLDASLKPRAEEILSAPPGAALAFAATTLPSTAGDLIHTGKANGFVGRPPAAPAGVGDAVPGGHTDTAPEKFHVASSAEAAAAMARARRQAEAVQKALGVTFQSFETDHFLVFTDWNEQEYDFLKTNLEGAYRVVAKQFESDPKASVFAGKLPVYMIEKYADFKTFAHDIDRFDANQQTAGYYMHNSAGFGHMAMWKPTKDLTGTSSLDDAKRLWAYVLVHEFTHAFLARYRTNVFVARWLNEGIAEVIAYGEFPYADRRRAARLMALNAGDMRFLFDDRNVPTGQWYPVMQSMVEMLVRNDRAAFLKLINQIKDGTDTEAALRDCFHVGYTEFISSWRTWAARRADTDQ